MSRTLQTLTAESSVAQTGSHSKTFEAGCSTNGSFWLWQANVN